MRKSLFRLLMLALPIGLWLTSCSSDNSDIVPAPSGSTPNVGGIWYAEIDSKGMYNGLSYDRIGQSFTLNADGTGYCATFFFQNGLDEPIEVVGGMPFTSLNYNVGADNRININFSPSAFKSYVDFYSKWSLTYADGVINCSADDQLVQLKPATDDEKFNILGWCLAANGGDDTAMYNIDKLSVTYGNTETHSFTLNNKIDTYNPSGTSDWLNKSGSIDLVLRVTPAYLQSSNGANAGDYYFVTCAVTPHNGLLWGPYKENHAWSQIRIYGYWFKELDLDVELVNEDGSAISGLSYYERPIPENKNNSKSYTSGKTISLSGTLSGGYSEKQGIHGEGSLTCGATWSSSSSYTLDDIEFNLDTSTPKVKYHYYSNNVTLKDDWDNMNSYFPTASHNEFTGRSLWVWKVASVKDGDTKKFKIKANVKATYSSWYSWRGAADFNSNRKDYSTRFDRAYTLDVPDRTPWGYIDLKNAMHSEMANVKFINVATHEVVKELSSSYSKDQIASAALREGTYDIEFDQLDPDTNNTLGSWIIKGVAVHQGRDKQSATISISTTSANKK